GIDALEIVADAVRLVRQGDRQAARRVDGVEVVLAQRIPGKLGIAPRLFRIQGDSNEGTGHAPRIPRYDEAAIFLGTSLNGLVVSTLGSLGILSTRSEMMLRWISSVPPAIEVAGTETRISAMTPFMGLSSPLRTASAPGTEA